MRLLEVLVLEALVLERHQLELFMEGQIKKFLLLILDEHYLHLEILLKLKQKHQQQMIVLL
jgi:hypothetical protein